MTLSIFSKPLVAITSDDVQRVVLEEYPEDANVEFKRSIPSKKGVPDTWAENRKVSEYGRNEVLAEVVAFANTEGGHVVLGIDETDSQPKRAASISPIPACAELADRFRLQARDCIEPQLPTFGVVAVPTTIEGAGVIVMRIPSSRRAPHRLRPTLHCYIRRSDRTETMTMREIQDLSLQRDRGLLRVDSRFSGSRSAFTNALNTYVGQAGSPNPIGIRAMAIDLDFVTITLDFVAIDSNVVATDSDAVPIDVNVVPLDLDLVTVARQSVAPT